MNDINNWLSSIEMPKENKDLTTNSNKEVRFQGHDFSLEQSSLSGIEKTKGVALKKLFGSFGKKKNLDADLENSSVGTANKVTDNSSSRANRMVTVMQTLYDKYFPQKEINALEEKAKNLSAEVENYEASFSSTEQETKDSTDQPSL